MEYSPPPLFKQGASARAKVVFFALIALTLLIADAHFRKLGAIRQVVGTALYPLQMVAVAPRDAAYRLGDYFTSLASLKQQNTELKLEQAHNAQRLQQAQHLLAENTQLRKLLGTSERLPVKAILSEILYDARDAFTRKIVLDRGASQGVALGQPVIDDIGVVGQVTRVFPFSAEITLLTDKDQAIPVQVVRSGLRSVAYGGGQSGMLDLRFMAANADIQAGDVLVTSGIDGIYPAGLAVAKVARIENKSTDAFAHILCQPAAGIDHNRQLLILLAESKIAPRMPPEESRDNKAKGGKKHAKEAIKDAPKTGATAPAPAAVVPARVTPPASVPATPAAAAPAVAPPTGSTSAGAVPPAKGVQR
ncbi:MAG: rod shape-determining protein MreC [Herminiimonas sp.]|nr:rod shape-determining protein MreC [Herminiimonas sp.]